MHCQTPKKDDWRFKLAKRMSLSDFVVKQIMSATSKDEYASLTYKMTQITSSACYFVE